MTIREEDMNPQDSSPKIAFFMDDRLPHDRKGVFTKLVSVLRPKYNFEIIPASFSEADFLKHLESHTYTVILLPWYRYLSWKKLETRFGSLRLEGPTIAGYFADAILPFELSSMPSFHQMILLDFYRLDSFEIETLLQALIFPDQKAGFRGILPLTTPIHHQDWFDHDGANTRCIDAIMNTALLKSKRWEPRTQQLRFFLTALWTLGFSDRSGRRTGERVAQLEIAEFSKRIAIKFVIEDAELTLKQTMEYFWPSQNHQNQAIHAMIKNSDFIRVAHFPESRQVEITAFFLESSPTLHHPGEMRGFWIEPQKLKYLRSSAEESFTKRIPIHTAKRDLVTEQFHEVLEHLKAVHLSLGNISHEERFIMEHQVSNIRFLIQAIEKKVAERKKIA